ncbi:MAG: flagellin, partial [Deltaproteobacteria bacterium]
TVFTSVSVLSVDVAGAKTNATYNVSAAAAGSISLIDGSGNKIVVTTVTANFTGTIDFGALGVKVKVNALASTTALDSKTVITSTAASAKFKIGSNGSTATSEDLSVSISSMKGSDLGVNALQVDTHDHALAAIDSIDSAIDKVNVARSDLGAYQNRIEHTINNLGASQENLTASESRIRDADMAKEMMEFTKNNILQQAATAMLAQANQQPQGVLQLLK